MTRAELVAWLERTLPADAEIDSIELGIGDRIVAGRLEASQGDNLDFPAAWAVRQRAPWGPIE